MSDKDKTKAGEEGTDNKRKKAKPGKLALSKKMNAALCSSFCVTEPQAKEFIDKLYKDIGEDPEDQVKE